MKYPNISIYEHIKQSESKTTIPIDIFLDNIRSGKWQDVVLDIRAKRIEKKQAKIPYVTISGTFSTRNIKGLIEPSGFICMDIDHVDNMPEAKKQLAADPYVYAAFMSIGGNGLAVIFKINPDKHLEAFEGLSDYLFTKYSLICDPACKDVSRARYVSFDPDIHMNEFANKFTKYPKRQAAAPTKVPNIVFVQSDFDDILREVNARGVDVAGSYHNWRNIGFAFADKFGEAGRAYFHMISMFRNGSQAANDRLIDRQYDACMKHKGNGITMATVYWLCKQAGIQTQSAQTKLIAQTAYQAKKQRRTKEDTMQLLEDVEKINPHDSIDIIDQVFDNDIKIESEDSLIDDLEMWLRQNYTFRRNAITRNIEKNGIAMQEKDFNTVFISAKKVFEKVDYQLVFRTINSDFTPTYHPIKDFFEDHKDVYPRIGTLEDGFKGGVIDQFFDSISTDTGMSGGEFYPDYAKHFGKKWLVGIISSVYGNHNPLQYVLSGEGNSGKTQFWRRLLPSELKPYYAESKLDKGKDDEILMTQKLLIMDDELGGKTHNQELKFRNTISKQEYSLREPYGKNNVDLMRLATLCATTNLTEILNDPTTRNRRIIPVHVLSINFEVQNTIERTDLFMEAWHLYQGGFKWELTKEDIDILEKNTSRFEESSAEYDLLCQYFQPHDPKNPEAGMFRTCTDIKANIELKSGQRISAKILGSELKRLGFERVAKKERGTVLRGYYIKEAGLLV